MKNLISLFIGFFIITSFSFTGCSGSNTSQIVCDYGNVLCDVSTTMCTQIPGIPPQVCNYLDLACYNLNQLCALRDSTDSVRYKLAISNLETITARLQEWTAKQVLNK